MRVSLIIWTCTLSLLSACAKEPVDSGNDGTLPPEETTDILIDSGFVVDSGDTGFGVGDQDREPEHTLNMTHEGEWNLTPLGGPYSAFTGHLDVLEILDGNLKEPACELIWSLTGEQIDEGEGEVCASCEFTFAAQFYLTKGDLEACMDPELPQDGEVWTFGYDAGEGQVLREYGGTGIWVPWFTAERDGDTLSVEWSATVGVLVEEEDE